MLTNQQIFDKVVAHLRQQNARSLDKKIRCAYRGENGMKCAVGCLIPDDKYVPNMEGKRLKMLPFLFDIFRDDDLDLLDDLQTVHDIRPIQAWEFEFRQIAKNHGLTYKQEIRK